MPAKKRNAVINPTKIVTKTACAVMASKSLKPLMVRKPLSKDDIKNLAATSGITKQQAALVFEGFIEISKLKQKNASYLALPGLIKFRVIHKPTTKA